MTVVNALLTQLGKQAGLQGPGGRKIIITALTLDPANEKRLLLRYRVRVTLNLGPDRGSAFDFVRLLASASLTEP